MLRPDCTRLILVDCLIALHSNVSHTSCALTFLTTGVNRVAECSNAHLRDSHGWACETIFTLSWKIHTTPSAHADLNPTSTAGEV